MVFRCTSLPSVPYTAKTTQVPTILLDTGVYGVQLNPLFHFITLYVVLAIPNYYVDMLQCVTDACMHPLAWVYLDHGLWILYFFIGGRGGYVCNSRIILAVVQTENPHVAMFTLFAHQTSISCIYLLTACDLDHFTTSYYLCVRTYIAFLLAIHWVMAIPALYGC